MRGPTEGGCIEITEDLEQDFAGKDGEWVDPDQVGELFGKEGELGEAAHGEEPMEDERATGVWGRGKVGPDD